MVTPARKTTRLGKKTEKENTLAQLAKAHSLSNKNTLIHVKAQKTELTHIEHIDTVVGLFDLVQLSVPLE